MYISCVLYPSTGIQLWLTYIPALRLRICRTGNWSIIFPFLVLAYSFLMFLFSEQLFLFFIYTNVYLICFKILL